MTELENYFKELTDIENFDIKDMESKAGKDITNVDIVIKASGEITTTTKCKSSSYTFDVIENK